jgi:hypothetical protein
LSLGSSFVLRDDLVATNYHVIKEASAGHVRLVGAKVTIPIQGVVAKDAYLDLAVLKVSGLQATALKLASASRAVVGDVVFAVGTPQGLEGTLSQGIVSGIRTFGKSVLFQITAPISPGSSGGPVVDASGNVLGIAVATLRGGQNLNFAISSAHLEELLRAAGSTEPLGSEVKVATGSEESVLAQIGGPGIRNVTASNVSCSASGYGSWHCNFSVENKLEISIRNVKFLVILKDKDAKSIDSREGHIAYRGPAIRPGLARRTSRIDGQFDIEDETKKLVSQIEVRVLNFEAVE